MNTVTLRINEKDSELDSKLYVASEIIKSGGLVVFPTETVYGLGADGTNESAAEKIYAAKGRPSDNPLIIHISDPRDAERYAYTSDEYYMLAAHFMPGPLTVVLDAKPTVPMKTRGGLSTVAIRCPSNRIANRLIALSGTAIAAPSANLSGSPSPTSASHVLDDMAGRVDMIIDGGDCDFGLESTIVKLDRDGSLTLLRPGRVTPEELRSLGLNVSVADAVTDKLGENEVALSPGMKYRHYAPKSPMVLVDSDFDKMLSYIKAENENNIAVITYSEYYDKTSVSLENAVIYDFGPIDDEVTQAHRLFKILREADKKNYSKIYAPLPRLEGVGLALYNRMIRAAAHKIIRL